MSPSLQDQINALTALSARVSSLRNIPPQLLRPPAYGLTGEACFVPDFTQFKEIVDTVKSDNVQTALKAARDSQKAADLDVPTARRKRRSVPSALTSLCLSLTVSDHRNHLSRHPNRSKSLHPLLSRNTHPCFLHSLPNHRYAMSNYQIFYAPFKETILEIWN